ncbi:MAG: DUF2442 domain-containing protein [Anaerolineae bacterium]|nr:DUF2442 domain-containing protein [Anaerolineae bacterium]
MFLHVVDVSYLDSYKLRLTFNNGVVKNVDLTDELYGEVFAPLRDIELFRQVVVNHDIGTIEWPNGADFAPEFLYEAGVEVKSSRRAIA